MLLRILFATAVLAAGLAVAGCGFRPVYGEGRAGAAEALADIYIETIPDRTGQKLHNLLLARLNPQGPPARPDYRLSVALTESVAELALRIDETATRANLTVAARFVLTPADPNDPRRFSGVASSTNSYNRLRSDYATLSAEEDARDRALRTLAEEIRLRIAVALENPGAMMRAQAPAAPPAPPGMTAPGAAMPLDRGDASPLLPGR